MTTFLVWIFISVGQSQSRDIHYSPMMPSPQECQALAKVSAELGAFGKCVQMQIMVPTQMQVSVK
jgi:hypothetical protein